MSDQKLTPAPAPQAPGKFVDVFPRRRVFFESIRQSFGALRQAQVDGINFIVDEFYKTKNGDDRHLAYQLATAWHETAATMQPIAEYGKGKGRPYGKPNKQTGFTYYGRGYVQLTHFENYQKYGIEKDPEKALDPQFAAFIMNDGMERGLFTGKKLSDYFNDKKADPVGARRIINGTDKAQLIATHYRHFIGALQPVMNVKA